MNQGSFTAGLFIPVLCGCRNRYSSHHTDLKYKVEGELIDHGRPVKWVLGCVHDEVRQPGDGLLVLGVVQHLLHRGEQAVSLQAVPVLQQANPVPHCLGHIGVLRTRHAKLDPQFGHLVPVDGNANDGGFVTDRLLGTSCTAVSDEHVHLENTIIHYVIGFTAR